MAKRRSGTPDTRAEGPARRPRRKAEQFKGKIKGALGDDI